VCVCVFVCAGSWPQCLACTPEHAPDELCVTPQDLTGKAVGIWLPISAFAMIGFEHSIANQFVIPMGIVMGADVDAKHFIWMNLIPCTLGNWVGGAICLATVYAMAYGRPHVYADEWWAKYADRRKAK
jgi:hypothetical protein